MLPFLHNWALVLTHIHTSVVNILMEIMVIVIHYLGPKNHTCSKEIQMITFRLKMIMKPWKMYVPFMYVCVHPLPFFGRDTFHIYKLILVFHPLSKLHCHLALIFHFTRFYCALLWRRERSRNSQAGMWGSMTTWSVRKAPFDPKFQDSFTKNGFHYNLNLWTT